MEVLTHDHLVKLGACWSQLRLFDEVFPNGAPVTIESLRTAKEAGLNPYWLTFQLPDDLHAGYSIEEQAAMEEYLLVWRDNSTSNDPGQARMLLDAYAGYKNALDTALTMAVSMMEVK